MQGPLLKGHDGGRGDEYDGEALMNEVYDLMRHRLPLLHPGDLHRPVVSQFLARLGDRLGRDRLVAVQERPESQSL